MSDDPTQDLPRSDVPGDVVTLIQGMSKQLSALQMTVDERLYDTRPLWESVQGQINDLRFETEQGLREVRSDVEAGFREMRSEMQKGHEELRAESRADIEHLNTELSRELRHISHSLDALHGKILRFETIQRDVEDRLRDLESKRL